MDATTADSTTEADKQAMFAAHQTARRTQHYRFALDTCANCANVLFDTVNVGGSRQWDRYETRPVRTNYRCGVGGFPVVVRATCDRHVRDAKSPTTSEKS